MELVGYLASGLVVVSLAMTSVVRLRVVSLIGSAIFVSYGLMLPSVPIIITNVAVAALNVWFLAKEFRPNRDLGAVPIAADAPFLVDFLRSHHPDIRRTWPAFAGVHQGDFVLLLVRDGLPAGALAGKQEGNTLLLNLDYVMSAYRDSRIGQWLYEGPGAKVLRDAGITRVILPMLGTHGGDYLRGVGFAEVDGALVRQL